MSAAHPKYRLFESTGYLYPDPFPAFADSDDFDTLRAWALDHNEWKDIRSGALIVCRRGTLLDGEPKRVDQANLQPADAAWSPLPGGQVRHTVGPWPVARGSPLRTAAARKVAAQDDSHSPVSR